MEIKSVLIIEDHPLMVDAIKEVVYSALGNDVKIDKAFGLQDTINYLELRNYGMAIVDLTIDGRKIFKSIDICVARQIPCIIYTASTHYSIIRECINRGVSAYVMKTSPITQLHEAVQSLLTPSELPFLCNHTSKIYKHGKMAVAPGKEVFKPDLSIAEEKVLKLIIKGKRNDEIAGYLGLRVDTIKKHRHNMINKNSRTIDALIHGYLFWYGDEN